MAISRCNPVPIVDEQPRPGHVAIIMDGNGRWARARHLPRTAGHRQGVQATRHVVRACAQRGISALTLFAFSSENWRRPRSEVNVLMELFVSTLEREVDDLSARDVQIRFIGDRSQFSERLQQQIVLAERHTADNQGLRLQIAANYGGRWDILQAARQLMADAQAGRLPPESLSESSFAQHLATAGIQEPDLFIRTGGERRISNFLLWQLAYTELYFTDVLWPDFNEDELGRALQDYARRQRRFGRTGEQLS